ncbi:hypothetical protein CE91St41_37560 [Oscillospiraceae bacterium]|nr:hypothetical protein CE91St40_37540 [Oscillospiraceae bacterium]BDF76867.1 hypothetical protein CE91St41_37560 [Oscillospiraceae bacterium]
MKNRRLTSIIPALALVFALAACGGEGPGSTPTPAPAPTPDARPVVEERFAFSGDAPDEVRVEVSLPRVREDLPGAQQVNGLIAADYAADLECAGTEDFEALVGGFAYPYYHIWYEAYDLGGLWEICILGEVYSLYGSGPALWVDRYYYDAAAGAAADEDAFLAAAGLTREQILEAYREQVVDNEEEAGLFTYEDARRSYYVDADGQLLFWANLYA